MDSPLDYLYYMPCVYNLLTNIVTVSSNLVAAIQILMAKPSNQIINQTNANTQKSKDFKIVLINSSTIGEQWVIKTRYF